MHWCPLFYSHQWHSDWPKCISHTMYKISQMNSVKKMNGFSQQEVLDRPIDDYHFISDSRRRRPPNRFVSLKILQETTKFNSIIQSAKIYFVRTDIKTNVVNPIFNCIAKTHVFQNHSHGIQSQWQIDQRSWILSSSLTTAKIVRRFENRSNWLMRCHC